MNIEPVLAEIRSLLEGGNAGIASDILFEFLLDNFGKPTAVDLPPNVGTLPPRDVISHLRRTLDKLFLDAQCINSLDNSEDGHSENFDLELILQTSSEYDARQKEYIPGEEDQEIPRHHLLKSILPVKPFAEKLPVPEEESPQPIIPEKIEPDLPPLDLNHVSPCELPEFLQDNIEEIESTDEDAEVFTEFEQKDDSESRSDGEWLLDDDLFYDGDEDDRAELIDVEYHGKISRQERAWQIAYDLGVAFGWDDQGIAMLQEVFIERGWQQARVAMEYLLREGMTPEQLTYARELKENWDLRPELTIAFYYTRTDRSNYCYAGEKILSWRVAIEIVRSFSGCNDFDEIEQFVEEALDTWYSNGRLRHDYKSFLQYLRSVVEHKECLSPNLLDLEPDEEFYMDTNDYLFDVLNDQLLDYGYSINLRPDVWYCAY